MCFSPTPNRIEAKRTKLFQNIARSKRNEQNCPKLNYMSVPIWDQMEGLTERGLRHTHWDRHLTDIRNILYVADCTLVAYLFV